VLSLFKKLSSAKAQAPICQFAQAGQQFGVEDGGSGGAANGVVREHGELPVEHAAGAQAADGHGHAVAAIAVEARLRAVGLRRPLTG
jgi:hypothetical protein